MNENPHELSQPDYELLKRNLQKIALNVSKYWEEICVVAQKNEWYLHDNTLIRYFFPKDLQNQQQEIPINPKVGLQVRINRLSPGGCRFTFDESLSIEVHQESLPIDLKDKLKY